MIKAILAGQKVQTRRVVKPQPEVHAGMWMWQPLKGGYVYGLPSGKWNDELLALWDVAPYRKGMRLWVRESWAGVNTEGGPAIAYKADHSLHMCSDDAFPVEYERYPGADFSMWHSDLFRGEEGHHWKNSMFMPRWASRLTLEVTGVRVERVQDISEEDARAEGAGISAWYCPSPDEATHVTLTPHHVSHPSYPACFRNGFANLWDSINGKRAGCAWKDNPYVWAVSFEVVQP
jgi:hypothetical protein